MKYKEIYAALNQRRQEVPGFSYSDYSGWRCLEQSSATLPLWVEAEDPVHHRRFIFKHYGIMIQTIIIDCDTHTEQKILHRRRDDLGADLLALFQSELPASSPWPEARRQKCDFFKD